MLKFCCSKERVQMRSEKGVTLVELVLVLVILGILAAMAIPMYQGAKSKSRATEAMDALSAIRKTLWVYYAEYGAYPAPAGTVAVLGLGLDLSETDLNGTFFDFDDYRYVGTTSSFVVIAEGNRDSTVAPSASRVHGLIRTIDQDGEIGTGE